MRVPALEKLSAKRARSTAVALSPPDPKKEIASNGSFWLVAGL